MTPTRRVLPLLLAALALPALADHHMKKEGEAKPAPAQGDEARPQEQPGAADPMAGWKPPKIANESKDRKEILALLQTMDAAGKKGDLEAAAALIDFPVLMITDDSKGQAGGDSWSREQWTKVMEPFYAKPMTDVSMNHRPTVFVVTDSLATVSDAWTMKMGKQKPVSGRSAMLLVRRDGAWKVKAMMEGGWGDMPMDGAPGEQPAR